MALSRRIRAVLLAVFASMAFPHVARAENIQQPVAIDKAELVVLIGVESQSAEVFVDDQAVETISHIELEPGSHRLEVRAKGFFAEGRTVLLYAGERTTVRFSLTPKTTAGSHERPDTFAEPSRAMTVFGAVLAGFGAAAATGAVVTGAIYGDTKSDLRHLIEDGECAKNETIDCPSAEDQEKADALGEKAYDALVMTVALGGGATFLLASSIALFASAPSKRSRQTVSVGPLVGTQGAGLVVAGSF